MNQMSEMSESQDNYMSDNNKEGIIDTMPYENDSNNHKHKDRNTMKRNSNVSTSSNDDENELKGLISFSTILYHGTNIVQAATEDNLPLFILLWTMAKSKSIKLFVSDNEGNTLVHYASLAHDNEVLQFTVKQLKGAKLNGFPLCEVPNDNGETPLMLAITKGYIPVVQTLLVTGCNIFQTDKNGLNIFNQCCKYGHLWLLHYLYVHVSKTYGEDKAMDMLESKDNDGHGVIEWSANSHNVQLIEYLIRRGIDPGEKDAMGRDSLHWAVKSGDPSTVKFLVMFGLDPRMEDVTGKSPLLVAIEHKNNAVIRSLIGDFKDRMYLRIKMLLSTIPNNCCKTTEILFTDIENKKTNTELWRKCYTKDMKSHAIYNHNYVRLNYLVLFTGVFSLFWFLSICFTLFTFFLVCLLFWAVYKYGLNRLEHKRKIKNAVTTNKFLSLFEEAVEAPEKLIGIWFCTFFAGLFYLLACYLVKDIYADIRYDMTINDFSTLSPRNFLILAATGAATYYPKFFYTCVIANMTCVLFFFCMVFGIRDPGIVDTRAAYFQEVLDSSLKRLGPPAHEYYCRTTMCKKPLRSKYCVMTGALVARMDHYCKYLHRCIGYKNHRIFLLFLLVHAIATSSLSILIFLSIWRDFVDKDSCYIMYTLFSRHYWFDCILGFTFILITIGVLGLLIEQITNIFQNITINERLNASRYDWLKNREDNSFCNKFDKGKFNNFLDFFRIISYNDYYNLYKVPIERNQTEKVLMIKKLNASNGTRTATTSDTLSSHS